MFINKPMYYYGHVHGNGRGNGYGNADCNDHGTVTSL